MRANLLEKIDNLQVVVTSYGFSVRGFKESILPLGKLARIKYKKKLKTKRLIKKYAKKILVDAINNFLKERLYDESQKSNATNSDL
jgi:hypothetical protein